MEETKKSAGERLQELYLQIVKQDREQAPERHRALAAFRDAMRRLDTGYASRLRDVAQSLQRAADNLHFIADQLASGENDIFADYWRARSEYSKYREELKGKFCELIQEELDKEDNQ